MTLFLLMLTKLVIVIISMWVYLLNNYMQYLSQEGDLEILLCRIDVLYSAIIDVIYKCINHKGTSWPCSDGVSFLLSTYVTSVPPEKLGVRPNVSYIVSVSFSVEIGGIYRLDSSYFFFFLSNTVISNTSHIFPTVLDHQLKKLWNRMTRNIIKNSEKVNIFKHIQLVVFLLCFVFSLFMEVSVPFLILEE